jgi:hypothetical protein
MFYIRTADRLVRTAPWVESFEGGVEVSERFRVHTMTRIAERVGRNSDES